MINPEPTRSAPDALIEHKHAIDAMLKRLTVVIADHFGKLRMTSFGAMPQGSPICARG